LQGVISPDDATKAARQRRHCLVEKESQEKTGLAFRCSPALSGGVYIFTVFKRYDDVRLVFAPEQQIAFLMGGYPDIFEYPRFDLRYRIFRAYENGHPQGRALLKWIRMGRRMGAPRSSAGSSRKDGFAKLTFDDLVDMARPRGVRTFSYVQHRREVSSTSFAAVVFRRKRARVRE